MTRWSVLGGGPLGSRLLRGRALRGGRLACRRLLGRCGLLGSGLGARRSLGAARHGALRRLLGRAGATGQLALTRDEILEVGAGAEARNAGLLHADALPGLGVASVAGGLVDLVEGTEAGHRDAVTCDGGTDDGVQDGVDSVERLLAASEPVGYCFDELGLVHEATPEPVVILSTDSG